MILSHIFLVHHTLSGYAIGANPAHLLLFSINIYFCPCLYTDTMQQLMKPCALRFWPSGAWFYLQDNASYHTSHRSLEWFHNNGVSLVELPRHSPDLNPIENLWADLNRRLESHHIQTIEELRDIIPLEWKQTTALTCSNLVDSMSDRMRAVVTAEGFKT